MKPTHSNKVKQYRFEDNLKLVKAVAIGNLILAFILVFPDFDFPINMRIKIVLLSVVLSILSLRLYQKKSIIINILIPLVYLGLFAYEWYLLGVPVLPISYDFEHYEMSKGFMFDLMIWLLPILYLSMRALLVTPMLKMVTIK